MYCPNCGKPLNGSGARCRDCRSLTPGFWLNAYSLAIWALIVFANYHALLWPGSLVRSACAKLELPMPLPTRMVVSVQNAVAQPLVDIGVFALAAVIVFLLVVPGRRMPVVKSGKALAVITWLAVLVTLIEMFGLFLPLATAVGTISG